MSKSTKALILSKFTELLKEYDLDKITVTMLVSKCNISRQTFYYHFSDIESLINWSVKEKTNQCLASAKSASNVKDATVCYLTYIKENKFFINKYFNSSLFPYTVKLLRNSTTEYIFAFYSKLVKNSHYSTEDTKFIIEFMSNAITGLIVSSITGKKEIDIEDYAERMSRTVFDHFLA